MENRSVEIITTKNQTNTHNLINAPRDTEELIAAKMHVYFAINNAIKKYPHSIISEDQKLFTVQNFIPYCLFSHNNQASHGSIFLSYSLETIENKLRETLTKLKKEDKFLGIRQNREIDHSTILYGELIGLTKVKENRKQILETNGDYFKFTNDLRKLEKDSPCPSENDSRNLIAALSQFEKIQNTSYARIKNICAEFQNKIFEQNQCIANIEDKNHKIYQRLYHYLECYISEEINKYQISIIQNHQSEFNVEDNINKLLLPYENEESKKSIISYLFLVIQREYIEEQLQNNEYNSLTKANHQLSKFTLDSIQAAAFNQEVINNISEDISNLKILKEFNKFKSFINSSTALKQLVDLEDNTQGYFNQLKELNLETYKSNEQKYIEIQQTNLAAIDKSLIEKARELFERYTKLNHEITNLKSSLEQIDSYIENYINTSTNTKNLDFDIRTELKLKYNINVVENQTQLNNIVVKLQTLPEIFLDPSITTEQRLSRFEDLINDAERIKNEFKAYTLKRNIIANDLDNIKNRLEQTHLIHKAIGDTKLTERVKFNGLFPLSSDDRLSFKDHEFKLELVLISYENKLQILERMKDKILDESNKIGTDYNKNFFSESCKKFFIEKDEFEKLKNEAQDYISNINEIFNQANKINKSREFFVNLLADEIEKIKKRIEQLSSLVETSNNQELDIQVQVSPLYKDIVNSKIDIIKKIDNAYKYLIDIEKINLDLSDATTYLTEIEIIEKIDNAKALFKDINLTTSEELDSLILNIKRLSYFNGLITKHNELLEKQKKIDDIFTSYDEIFGNKAYVPDYAVNTKLHHQPCKVLFSKLSLEISDKRNIINTKLSETLNLINANMTSDNVKNIDDVVTVNFNNIIFAQQDFSRSLGKFSENQEMDYFKNAFLSKSLALQIVKEEHFLKTDYDNVVEYLNINIKKGHIPSPNFKYQDLKHPDEQHIALNKIYNFARGYKPIGNEAQIQASNTCATNLLNACDRRPPMREDKFKLPDRNSIPKKVKLSFTEKIKNRMGTFIGTIAGGVGGAFLGGGLGALFGFFIAPVTLGLSIPLGAAIGSIFGGIVLGGGIGAGIGAAIGTCIDGCTNVDPEEDVAIITNITNEKNHSGRKNTGDITKALDIKPGKRNSNTTGSDQGSYDSSRNLTQRLREGQYRNNVNDNAPTYTSSLNRSGNSI